MVLKQQSQISKRYPRSKRKKALSLTEEHLPVTLKQLSAQHCSTAHPDPHHLTRGTNSSCYEEKADRNEVWLVPMGSFHSLQSKALGARLCQQHCGAQAEQGLL